MKTRKRNLKRSKRGLVLPLVIGIGVILAILGMGLLKVGFGGRLNSILMTMKMSARSAADTGLAEALYKLNEEFVFGVGPGDPLPSDANVPLANSNARYSYQVEALIDPVTGENYWLITSTGTSVRETKTVYARTSIVNVFELAIIVSDRLIFKANTLVDGYNSAFGYPSPPLPPGEDYDLKIGTNSNVPPPPTYPIVLNNNVIIRGDVLVGVGGNPDELIWDPLPLEETGNRYALPYRIEFPAITAPTDFNDLPKDLVGNDLEIVAPLGYTYEYPYTVAADGGSVNIGQGGRLTVVGAVELYVTGDMRFGQGAELYIGIPEDDPDYVPPGDPAFIPSSLIIYLDGDLDGGNAGGINNLTGIPANFILFGTSPIGPPYQDWDIKNSRNFYGVYYGPDANILVRADADIFGSVAGHSFDMRNSGNMHYDVRLSDLEGFDDGFTIDRWWEIVGPAP